MATNDPNKATADPTRQKWYDDSSPQWVKCPKLGVTGTGLGILYSKLVNWNNNNMHVKFRTKCPWKEEFLRQGKSYHAFDSGAPWQNLKSLINFFHLSADWHETGHACHMGSWEIIPQIWLGWTTWNFSSVGRRKWRDELYGSCLYRILQFFSFLTDSIQIWCIHWIGV